MRIMTRKRLHRYIFSLLGGVFAVASFMPVATLGQFADDTNFPYEIQGQEYNPMIETPTTDIASTLIKPDTKESKSLLQRLTDYFRLSNTQYYTNTNTPATNYVKRILNILL